MTSVKFNYGTISKILIKTINKMQKSISLLAEVENI